MSRRIRTTRQARKLRAIAIRRKLLARVLLNEITTDKISVGAITADKITAGAVTPVRLRLEYPPRTTSQAPEGSPE